MGKNYEQMMLDIEVLSEKRKQEIRGTEDLLQVSGRRFYLSSDGDDGNDGQSIARPWKTLERLCCEPLESGDGVFLRRGDVFCGQILATEGVSYGAYGTGAKPRIHSWNSLTDPNGWELFDKAHSIWTWKEPILDVGTLVFDGGVLHSRKLIPSYFGGFVCRNNPEKEFVMAEEMTQDLDIFWQFDDELTTTPSRGEDFPIPVANTTVLGKLYLRCDGGNPALCFSSIEALCNRHLVKVSRKNNVRIDNLCLEFGGAHAVSAGGDCVHGLSVTNCEIGWIGGVIQHYLGLDPNAPTWGRGHVTRYGNGVEIYGGCKDYLVENCYIYQIYDAAITHQITSHGKPYPMENICYRNNLVENCVYSIEYFLDQAPEYGGLMRNVEIAGNILRLSGYGWGQQRHNFDTPAHIKGWNYDNAAENFVIRDNIFDRAAYRTVHTVARDQSSLPVYKNNVYIQGTAPSLGQHGAIDGTELPPMLPFTEVAVTEALGDKDAKVLPSAN